MKLKGFYNSMCFLKLLFLVWISILVSLFPLSDSGGDNDKVLELEDKILSLAKSNSDFPLLDAVSEINKIPLDEGITLCVRLLDYYIGAGPSEILAERITEIGEKIIPFLVEKKNSPIMCRKEFETLCVRNHMRIEERNKYIQDLIIAIKNGVILYSGYPEGVEKVAENDIKIIKIFITDYKNKIGQLPKNLESLKEYVWKEYGYNLHISDPWDVPYKYKVLKNKYELKCMGCNL